jgi:hypothetical protein
VTNRWLRTGIKRFDEADFVNLSVILEILEAVALHVNLDKLLELRRETFTA